MFDDSSKVTEPPLSPDTTATHPTQADTFFLLLRHLLLHSPQSGGMWRNYLSLVRGVKCGGELFSSVACCSHTPEGCSNMWGQRSCTTLCAERGIITWFTAIFFYADDVMNGCNGEINAEQQLNRSDFINLLRLNCIGLLHQSATF